MAAYTEKFVSTLVLLYVEQSSYVVLKPAVGPLNTVVHGI